jgi:integrase/recombinase XerD
MASSSTRPPSTSAAPPWPPTYPPSGSLTCSSRPCSRPHGNHRTPCDFALVAMLGLLGLRIFEATSANIADLGDEHGPGCCECAARAPRRSRSRRRPRTAGAIDRATGRRDNGPILLNSRGTRMDRHAATRRLWRLAGTVGLRTKIHPHMLRYPFVTTMLDAGVDLRDVQIAARHADRAPRCVRPSPHQPGPPPNHILAAHMSPAT